MRIRQNFVGLLLLLLLAAVGLFFAYSAFTGFVPVAEMQSAATLAENFEAGSKTAYAVANVNLASGSWYFDDALLGNTTSDHKTGEYAARVRNTGVVSMNFNVGSAGTVSVQAAVYGTDTASSWELWQSTNNGSSWTNSRGNRFNRFCRAFSTFFYR